jgi:ABC-type spermidine/putrescine transport system permease subunit I
MKIKKIGMWGLSFMIAGYFVLLQISKNAIELVLAKYATGFLNYYQQLYVGSMYGSAFDSLKYQGMVLLVTLAYSLLAALVLVLIYNGLSKLGLKLNIEFEDKKKR